MYASGNPNRRRRHGRVLRTSADCQFGLCLPALANPHRFALVVKLCDEEASVSELVEWLGLTQPTVSHHLAVLREAGLVKVRHVAQQRLYSADRHWISQCCGRLFYQLHADPGRLERRPSRFAPVQLRGRPGTPGASRSGIKRAALRARNPRIRRRGEG